MKRMSVPSELPLTLEVFEKAPIGHIWRVNRPKSYGGYRKPEGYWEFEKIDEESFSAARPEYTTDRSKLSRYRANPTLRPDNVFLYLTDYETANDDADLWE